jgi:pilus assembly protein Flp/PilA
MIEYPKTSLALTADRRGLGALEYALIAGLVALAVLTASTILGGGIDNAFSHLASLL